MEPPPLALGEGSSSKDLAHKAPETVQRVTELTYFLLVPKDGHVFVQALPLLPGQGRRSLEDSSPQHKASGHQSPQETRFNTHGSEQN